MSYPRKWPSETSLVDENDWNGLLDHSLEKTASYIIRNNNGTIEAINGSTGKIDYSGTDASTVIQSAINALTSGGKIFIKQGTYYLNTGLICSKPIEVEMEKDGYFRANATPMTMLKLQSGATRSILKNVRLYSPLSGVVGIEVNTCDFVRIYNAYIYLTSGGSSRGIYAVDVNDLTVRDCYVLRASYGIGIYKSALSTMYNNKILNNHVENITILGIHAQYCSELEIKGNVIKNTNDNGIDVLNSAYFTVVDNQLVNAGNPNGFSIGIYQEADGTCHDGIVTRNVIRDWTSFWVQPTATNIQVFRNIGYVTENSGKSTFSGDGSTTTFTIAHGLAKQPTKVLVTAGSDAAKGDFYVTADATNITVTYATAPPSGTNNVVLNWYAEI
jgi:parallel beta-helix repeat protein